MKKYQLDVDEVLQAMAAQTAKNSENVRSGVRDLTLRGLQARKLSLKGIHQVIHSVTAGVNLGVSSSKLEVETVLSEALAGMDDAVLKAIEASQVALNQLASDGADFENSKLKKSLSEIEHIEDEFLNTVKQTSETASGALQAQWAGVLSKFGASGTASGAQVSAFMDDLGQKIRAQVRSNRNQIARASYMLGQNFTTLASGILIGLSQAMQRSEVQAAPASPAAPAATKSSGKFKPKPSSAKH